MKVRKWCLVLGTVFSLGCAAGAWAQSEEEPVAEERPAVGQPDMPGGAMSALPEPARRMAAVRRLRAEMTDRLELDQEQAEELDAIFEEYYASIQDEMASRRERQREQADEIRELVEEMRAAREDEDTQRIAEIRQQIADIRSNKGSSEEQDLEEFFDVIREVLYEDQIEGFDEMAAKVKTSQGGSTDSLASIQRMRRASEMVEMPMDQRRSVREAINNAQRELRSATADPGAAAAVAENMRNAILEQLDETQAAEFEEHLAKLEKTDRERKAASERTRERRQPRVEREAPEKEEAAEHDEVDPESEEQKAEEQPPEDPDLP